MSNIHQDPLVKQCLRAWKSAGQGTLLLAVSGGADSTALLIACTLANIPFEVAHCNFNLRGSESKRDLNFVSALCRDFNVKLHITDFDTSALVRKGESLEMTCRRLRYGYFNDLLLSNGFSRIVTAHNADDNAETFFLNALRGSGIKGLKAMLPDNGRILRPFLMFSRNVILNFLNSTNHSFVTDSTNLQSDFRRNFLRNEVFPLMKSRWEGFDKAVSSTISILQKEYNIIEFFISRALKDTDGFLPKNVIEEFPDKETLILRFILPFGGSPALAEEMAWSLFNSQPGKKWNLGNGNFAVTTKFGIKIVNLPADSSPLQLPMVEWEKIDLKDLEYSRVAAAPLSEIYLSVDPASLSWANAEKGMKIQALGMKGSQDVWKILKDKGLPVAERNSFPVLIDGNNRIIWLPGVKRSSLYLITPDSPVVYHGLLSSCTHNFV